ncbi:L-ribulokinase [Gelidibacter sediminis]|uniref:L-ribulokinase n=1 Tax=Gelidibacter sediminis TaxID=1608710 RepID=A0A4R7PXV3_9FLAO|nr:ribulokinase [Gelidibacter sediminis]TDU39795.1 L-ribulokinase [Gelidibacter sediminis]
MRNDTYVIGIDYGSDCVRAVVISALNGDEISTATKDYNRWSQGLYCDPLKNQYRQHPLDYIEALEEVVKDVLSTCDSVVTNNIVALSFDTTGSTPVLVDQKGMPLALKPEFFENPNAMFVLWKDHTAIKEAEEINKLAKQWREDYTKYEGGIYSSEWVWAKMLHVLREDESIRKEAFSWVEHCDWMPALVTGNTLPKEIKRSRCAAGHKAMWHTDWEGLPSEAFLSTLDPLLLGFRERLYNETFTSGVSVGNLSDEWAVRLGLTTNVKVGVGIFDAHSGAVGGEIKPGALLRIIGTSTCDIMVVPYEQINDRLIQGICGQVDGSVVPGLIGLEAGQSAFGDIYAWFKEILSWPLTLIKDQKLVARVEAEIIEQLSFEASKLPVTECDIIATDWLNGRRTPDADQTLKATITGLTLGTTAPMIFKSLVEASAFGSKAIVNRLVENSIEIKEIIALGGVAKKSEFVMQTLSNVLNLKIKVAKSNETCALGAAMYAAVVGGVYNTLQEAQKAMGYGMEKEYFPNASKAKVYESNYNKYTKLGKC